MSGVKQDFSYLEQLHKWIAFKLLYQEKKYNLNNPTSRVPFDICIVQNLHFALVVLWEHRKSIIKKFV